MSSGSSSSHKKVHTKGFIHTPSMLLIIVILVISYLRYLWSLFWAGKWRECKRRSAIDLDIKEEERLINNSKVVAKVQLRFG